MNKVMPLKVADWEKCAAAGKCPNNEAVDMPATKCVNGKAGEYPCSKCDLLSHLSLATLTARGDGNDIWGWHSKGREFAIMGTYDRTVFVEVTNPENPVVIGFLMTHTVGSSWRDIKVYQNVAFIVSEAQNHGMQIFDLTQLERVTGYGVFSPNASLNAPIQFTETAWYGQFGNCHNIAINEDTGFAYAVGTRTCGGGGLHMINIRNPINPIYAGCFGDDGYVHDTQCVIYNGPDHRFINKEICFCYNEEHLTIVDVSIKTAPVMLSTIDYQGVQYTHQGWLLNKEMAYLLLNDELDEMYNSRKNTRTIVWDVSDVTEPVISSTYYNAETVIDHNLYTLGKRAYLSNYCGGLRVYDTSAIPTGGVMKEVNYFDVSPDCATTSFLGSWSNYPYLPSGIVIVSSIDRGLFTVRCDVSGQ